MTSPTNSAPGTPRPPNQENSEPLELLDPTVSQKIADGFERAVDLARHLLDDPDVPPYVKIQAMTFFTRNHHLAEASDQVSTPQERFLTLMSDIRSVRPAHPLVTDEAIIEVVDEADDEADDGPDPLYDEANSQPDVEPKSASDPQPEPDPFAVTLDAPPRTAAS